MNALAQNISNTQSTSIISYPTDKEHYLKFKAAFQNLARNKNITSYDLVLYNILRGFAKKRGFTPVTNTIKINNGHHEWAGYSCAYSTLQVQIKWNKEFFDRYPGFTVTDELKKKILDILAIKE